MVASHRASPDRRLSGARLRRAAPDRRVFWCRLVMGEPERHSIPPPIAACPGLDAGARWDEPVHLRGELLPREQLNAHAVELAKAHGAPIIQKTPGPLRRRFALAKQRVFDAYEILGRGAAHRRE